MSKYSTDVISSKTEAPKVTEIFSDANEKNTKVTVVYGKSGDNYVYYDAASATAATEANRIDKDTLLNILLKGAVVSYGDVYYKPVSFKEADGVVSLVIATVINAASTASVTLNSKEYSAD